MTNYSSPQNLGFAFTLADRYTLQQQAEVAKAFDNIILCETGEKRYAQKQRHGDQPVDLSATEAIERAAFDETNQALGMTVDYLMMYIPDIPPAALVAALYRNMEFSTPADETYSAGDDVAFLAEEHDEETSHYYKAFKAIHTGTAKDGTLPPHIIGIAAKAELVVNMMNTIETTGHKDLPDFFRNIRLTILQNAYEKTMALANLTVDMSRQLDCSYRDHMEAMSEIIDEKIDEALALEERRKISPAHPFLRPQ